MESKEPPKFQLPLLTPRLASLSARLEEASKLRRSLLPHPGLSPNATWEEVVALRKAIVPRMEALEKALIAKHAFAKHVGGKGFRSQL
jgi:hypothetical protein